MTGRFRVRKVQMLGLWRVDKPGPFVPKHFDTFHEAIAYADRQANRRPLPVGRFEETTGMHRVRGKA